MGRLNKKLQQKERKKLGGSAISKSAVLATLADRDKKKSETSILIIAVFLRLLVHKLYYFTLNCFTLQIAIESMLD